MLTLIQEFLSDRYTALAAVRGAVLGLGMYAVSHEAAFPNWAEITLAVANAMLFGVSGRATEPKSDRISREKEQP